LKVLALGLEQADPFACLCVVLGERAESLGHGWFPFSGELGVAAHPGDGHAGVAQPLDTDFVHPGTPPRLAALREVAQDAGATPNQVVLA
jgi:hypothetical protein